MKLLYKELMLAAHPSSLVFALLGCLVLVPAYPYTVIFMFGCLALYLNLLYVRETNDTWYTSLLPVSKQDIVRGKFLMIVSLQLFQLTISIPSVLLRHMLGMGNNPVGIDATVAWYGFGLIIYGVFDLIFFPVYYKNGYQCGKAFIIAAIPMLVLMMLAEGSVRLPPFSWLDQSTPQALYRQIPILILGIFCYSIFLAFSYRISVRRFQKGGVAK